MPIAARAQADQCVAAGQRVDQVGDERAVVAELGRLLLAEEVLHAHPEPVGQDVAVRHHDQVRRPAGLRLVRWQVSGGFCPGRLRRRPVKAECSTPWMRAAITRGPPCGLKLARIFAGSGIFTWSTGTSPDRGDDVSNGVKSILASGALARKPDEATVTCCKSAVAGSLWLMPSRMLNQAT